MKQVIWKITPRNHCVSFGEWSLWAVPSSLLWVHFTMSAHAKEPRVHRIQPHTCQSINLRRFRIHRKFSYGLEADRFPQTTTSVISIWVLIRHYNVVHNGPSYFKDERTKSWRCYALFQVTCWKMAVPSPYFFLIIAQRKNWPSCLTSMVIIFNWTIQGCQSTAFSFFFFFFRIRKDWNLLSHSPSQTEPELTWWIYPWNTSKKGLPAAINRLSKSPTWYEIICYFGSLFYFLLCAIDASKYKSNCLLKIDCFTCPHL